MTTKKFAEDLSIFKTKLINNYLLGNTLYPNIINREIIDVNISKNNNNIIKHFSKDEDWWLTELIIGVILNKFNNKNFVNIIGYKIIDDCKIENFRHTTESKNSCVEIYMNYIEGPTIKDYVKTCEFLDFKNVFYKIVKSHYNAYTKYDFTHYDLHSENVIISLHNETPEPIFIDFGESHIKININGEYYNIGHQSTSKWYKDIFKLLATIHIEIMHIEDCKNNGVEKLHIKELSEYNSNKVNLDAITNYCISLMKFFISDIDEKSLVEYKKKHYYWDIDENIYDYKHFINFIDSNF